MKQVRLSETLGPAFRELAGDVLRHGHTHYDLAGGRGSLKSSTVSLLVPLILLQHPDAHALVLRKVANTIRDSVYSQYAWALEKLGMAGLWTARLSPMELIYRPTGQKIMFRGADDPMKLKSIKAPFGYIAVTHFEEKDQFAGRGEIDTILQSTMRGGELFWNFESYNPPLSRDNWANLDSQKEREDRLCHRSCYLDVPPEWLGPAFLDEAEHKKRTDERYYRHTYLGEAVGAGAGVPGRGGAQKAHRRAVLPAYLPGRGRGGRGGRVRPGGGADHHRRGDIPLRPHLPGRGLGLVPGQVRLPADRL